MKMESFNIGQIYSFTIHKVEHQNGVDFFRLLFKGKATRPHWVDLGWTYHTPVLPAQACTDLQQYIGKKIKCRVAYLTGDFPTLEQCESDNNTPSGTLLPTFNLNGSTKKGRKTELREVASNRKRTKEPKPSVKATEKVSITLPSESTPIAGKKVSASAETEMHRQKDQAPKKSEAAKKQGVSDEVSVLETRAENGDTDAQFDLGQHYEKKGSKKQANQWYQRAAELGHMDAKFRLGVLYLQKAIKLFQDAAEQNHVQAVEELDRLTKPEATPLPDSVLQHIWMHDTEEDEQFSISSLNRQTHKTGVGYPAGTSYQAQDFSAYEVVAEKATHEEDKEEDADLLRVWMERHSSVEGGETISIADGATGNHGNDDATNIWTVEEKEEYADPESSGNVKVESEQHNIELLDSSPAPVSGCICCPLIHGIKNLFSHLFKR